MGRVFVDHIGGTLIYCCIVCNTMLTNRSELISTRFNGATGRAFLFNRAVNLRFGAVEERAMLSGRHLVRDANCKKCDAKVGWVYEFTRDKDQRFKEGRIILEQSLIKETLGMD